MVLKDRMDRPGASDDDLNLASNRCNEVEDLQNARSGILLLETKKLANFVVILLLLLQRDTVHIGESSHELVRKQTVDVQVQIRVVEIQARKELQGDGATDQRPSDPLRLSKTRDAVFGEKPAEDGVDAVVSAEKVLDGVI